MSNINHSYNHSNRNELIDMSFLLKKLSDVGYIILGDFKGLEDFQNFTSQMKLKYRKYLGAGVTRESYLSDETLLNVNLPGDFGGSTLHGEQYYLSNPPNIIFFYCNKKAEIGGETLLCDGKALLDGLPELMRNKFIKKNIIYKWRVSEKQWQEMINGNNVISDNWECTKSLGGQVDIEFKTKATWNSPNGGMAFINSILPMIYDFEEEDRQIQVVFEDGSIIDKTIGEVILKTAKDVQKIIKLNEKQGIVIDNRWFLHGRTPFTGEREMYIRMS